jgi:thymidylate kinase
MKKGIFLTLYGINNIGKSTQAKLLVDNLRKNGYDAVAVKYPVYDIAPTGPFLNHILRSSNHEQKIPEEELQMWFTLNRFQFQEQLKEWLAEGQVVVAEDYTGTGLAWGSAKGANLDWLISLNKPLLQEDFSLFLKGKRNLSAKENVHLHENNDDVIEACQFILENLAKKYNWKTVSVKPSINDTAKEIWDTVEEFLKKQ